MYRQRTAVLKWGGLVLMIGVVGWFFWQNQQADEAGWIISDGVSLVQANGSDQGKGAAGSAFVASAQGVVDRGGDPEERQSHADVGTRAMDQSGNDRSSADGAERIAIHAAGAVRQPGVYYLQAGARVVDVVKAAGGVVGSGDLNAINLAGTVSDGEQVFIPYKDGSGTTTGYVIRGGVASSSGGSDTHLAGTGAAGNTRATTGAQTGGSSSAAGYRSSAGKGKVNINTASREELISLPGIAESKAEAIIRYRESHGRFQRPEDLMAVGGIGEKTFARLKDQVTV